MYPVFFYALPFLVYFLDQGIVQLKLLISLRVDLLDRLHGRLRVSWPGWWRMQAQPVTGVAWIPAPIYLRKALTGPRFKPAETS